MLTSQMHFSFSGTPEKLIWISNTLFSPKILLTFQKLSSLSLHLILKPSENTCSRTGLGCFTWSQLLLDVTGITSIMSDIRTPPFNQDLYFKNQGFGGLFTSFFLIKSVLYTNALNLRLMSMSDFKLHLFSVIDKYINNRNLDSLLNNQYNNLLDSYLKW